MGRSKPRAIVDIKSLCREHTQKCVDVLIAILEQPKTPPAVRVAAAHVLLDRGWGKPAQVVTGDESGVPISVIHRVIVSLPDVVDDAIVIENDENTTPIATPTDNGDTERNDINGLDE